MLVGVGLLRTCGKLHRLKKTSSMSLRPNAFVVTVVIFVNLAAIMCGLQTG